MEVIIRPDADAAVRLVAEIVAQSLARKPGLVLGLATGRTMESLYDLLVLRHREQGLDFARATTFNLDEYIGLPAGDPNSYHHFMTKWLFGRVNIDLANTHLPNGSAPDIDAECDRYERAIAEAGGIDLQILGIGRSGHIGFNEPLSALRSRTRAKALAPQTIEQNAALFGGAENVPPRAITMGVGTILDSQRCVMLATGAEKAAVIAKAVEGPVTSMISASALQLHPHCAIIVDEEAARHLENTGYYRWIFDNEPEWESFRNIS